MIFQIPASKTTWAEQLAYCVAAQERLRTEYEQSAQQIHAALARLQEEIPLEDLGEVTWDVVPVQPQVRVERDGANVICHIPTLNMSRANLEEISNGKRHV